MIAASLAAMGAAAQMPGPPSGKIGYVNSERVMQLSTTTRKLKQALEDKFEKLVKEIDAGPQDQVERRRIALDEDIGLEREDALRQFVDRTNRVIRRIALEENLDIVFLEAAFASAQIDLTARVIKELDAEP
jgi:Skp family chaperone for outer membrane proteins